MRIKSIKKPIVLGLVVPALIFLFAPPAAFAFVSGPCDDCHTMHNSEENNPIAVEYDPATPGTQISAPNGFGSLLVSDCVSCHTSSGAPSYTLPGGSEVPVVYTTGPPVGGVTAGGNFYYTTLDPKNGHNVRGIVADDSLLRAPGAGSIGCAGSCHDSLTLTDAATTATSGSNVKTNGCQGCHLKVGHHARSSIEDAGVGTYSAGNAYRFLSGHDDSIVGIVPSGGGFYEDPDWEITTLAGDNHNIYKAQLLNPEKHPYIPIGRWCAGCHADFHAYGLVEELTGLSGGGDRDANNQGVNPWLRHPTNVNLPTTFDFSWVLGGEPYNPDIPVARSTPNRSPTINNGDQVMCLSCHKAHASEWPKALRWDYDTISAHTNAAKDSVNGCFFCHRTKDDL